MVITDLGNVGKSCVAAQAVHVPMTSDKTLTMREAVAKKASALAGIRYRKSDAEITADLQERLDKLSYVSDAQKAVRSESALADVLRYVHYEMSMIHAKYHSTLPTPSLVVKANGVETRFRPDLLFYRQTTDGTIYLEAEIVSTGKRPPAMTQKGADNGSSAALRLYFALLYMRQITRRSSRHYVLVARMIWMRRQDDKYARPGKPYTNVTDLTSGKPGNRIEIVEERFGSVVKRYYFDHKGVRTAMGTLKALPDWDAIYAPAVGELITGTPEENHSDEDCERCPFYDECHYELPPLQMKAKAGKVKANLMIPSKAQQEAIDVDSGIVRINAGPGAGKTFVITQRVVRLLDDGVDPAALLLITFTDAAAKEMRERITKAVALSGVIEPAQVEKMQICTFNAFGDEIIKATWAKLGFTAEPRLLKAVTKKRIISDLLSSNPLPHVDPRSLGSSGKFDKSPVDIAAKIFDFMKAEELGTHDVDQVYSLLGADKRFASKDGVEEMMSLYPQFDDTLRAGNYIEFADQEAMIFELLQQDPFYFNGFNLGHIIVDEFQDTSERQMDILKKLTETPSFKSLMVVGDDSQAIYGFRNTSPEFIINFSKYIGAPVRDIDLLENHRSTPEVVDFANKLMQKNTNKIAKTLISTRKSIGRPVVVRGFFRSEDEYAYILADIKAKLAKGAAPEDIAFIGYTKMELMKMAALLRAEGIPSVMMNPEPLIENGRVRAAVAMVKAIDDPFDTKDTLSYANGLLGGGLLKKSSEEISQLYKQAANELAAVRELPEKAKRAEVIKMLDNLNVGDDEVYAGFVDTLRSEPTFKGILQYCRDFYLFGQDEAVRRNRKYPGVVLTTAHSSKGLEWKVVFNSLSKYDSEEMHGSNISYAEERRRLLYVSATRAKDELIITGLYTGFTLKDPDHPKVVERVRNQFLLDSFDSIGHPMTEKDISIKEAEYDAARKAARTAAKLQTSLTNKAEQ